MTPPNTEIVQRGLTPYKDGPPMVLPHHLADLRKSGLSDTTIATCGFSSITSELEARAILRWQGSTSQLLPALCIPFLDRHGERTGFARLKPDYPRTKSKNGKKAVVKYEQPLGVPIRPYFPSMAWALIDDATQPLLYVEGEKKAAKAAQEGFACVGLTGVDCWSIPRKRDAAGKPLGRRELLPDLAALPHANREVFIVFDTEANCTTRENVARAAKALALALYRAGATVRVVRLPDSKDGAKVGLDDYLREHTADDLRGLMAEAPFAFDADGRRPVRLCPDEAQVTREVTDGLAADPGLYQREGELVRPLVIERADEMRLPTHGRRLNWRRPAGMVVLRPASEAYVRLRVAERCVLLKDGKDGPSQEHPPVWLPRAVMACPGMIRAVGGLLPGPTLDAEGRLINEPGYDQRSRWFLGCALPGLSIPERPGHGEAVQAAALLGDLVADFPFQEVADRARWLCLLLTACCRHLMGRTPIGLITANVAGSGKTYLARLISIIAHGHLDPITMSWPESTAYKSERNEIRKRLASLLHEGATFALIDNLPRGEEFGSPELEAFVANDSYYDRLLGKNDGQRVGGINRCLLICTGNNVAPAGDTADRTLLVRLLCHHPNPRSRHSEEFRICNLEQHALHERCRYLGAALTIWRAWIHAGCPQPPGEAWGTFEDFAQSSVSVVRWLDWGDPLKNRVKMAGDLDREGAALEALVSAWRDVLGSSARGCSEIITALDSESPSTAVQAMRDALCRLGNCRWPVSPTKLGNILQARLNQTADAGAGKVTTRLKISGEKDTARKTWRYFVEEVPLTGVAGVAGVIRPSLDCAPSYQQAPI